MGFNSDTFFDAGTYYTVPKSTKNELEMGFFKLSLTINYTNIVLHT